MYIREEPKIDNKRFMKVMFYNKGIELINSSILHSKKVRSTLPDFIQEKEPPVIGTYTNNWAVYTQFQDSCTSA